jgi:hypothetical protein
MPQKTTIVLPLLLITLGFVSRLLPHPANFAPIGAIALFAGLYLPKRWAIILPMLAMFASDYFIGFYNWRIMLAVYGSFAIAGLIGLWVRKNKKFHTILGGTLLGSITFFTITNFAVWAFGTMYTHNFDGLTQCYTMAIPFFKNTLLGDIFYTTILVGSFELAIRRQNETTRQALTR